MKGKTEFYKQEIMFFKSDILLMRELIYKVQVYNWELKAFLTFKRRFEINLIILLTRFCTGSGSGFIKFCGSEYIQSGSTLLLSTNLSGMIIGKKTLLLAFFAAFSSSFLCFSALLCSSRRFFSSFFSSCRRFSSSRRFCSCSSRFLSSSLLRSSSSLLSSSLRSSSLQ